MHRLLFIFFLPSFFFVFKKLLIGVPSGNHDVLSARSDLTHQMERFLNSVHFSQVSVGGSVWKGDDQLDKLVEASVGFIRAGHSHLRPLLPHVNHLRDPIGAKVGVGHNPAWPAAAKHSV